VNIATMLKRESIRGVGLNLMGGGLIRSIGGWFSVKALRRSGDRELSDDRILGSGEFVERIIKEADAKIKYQLPVKEQNQK
jgi:putative transposase